MEYDVGKIGEVLERLLEGIRLSEVGYCNLRAALGKKTCGTETAPESAQAHDGDSFAAQAVGIQRKSLKELCAHGFRRLGLRKAQLPWRAARASLSSFFMSAAARWMAASQSPLNISTYSGLSKA